MKIKEKITRLPGKSFCLKWIVRLKTKCVRLKIKYYLFAVAYRPAENTPDPNFFSAIL
jgi:hypothetical protein